VKSSQSYVTTDSRPVCLGVKHASGAQHQVFITVRQLWVCWCGAPSVIREWACRLQLLLVLASAVILVSESCGTHDHILLSRIHHQPGGPGPHIYILQEQGGPVIPPGTGFPFQCLLWLAELRWRYSYLPPRGGPNWLQLLTGPGYNTLAQTMQKTSLALLLCSLVVMETCLFAELLLSNDCCIVACFVVTAQQWVYMPQYCDVFSEQTWGLDW
jgi:hypothetical protein